MIDLDAIREAAKRLDGRIVRTPLLRSDVLSALTGAEIFVKFENHQFTASFKERGALNRLLLLGESEVRRGVVAMSAGNHAQGVAYHSRRLGIPATIVMPTATPFIKVEHTRAHGAEVVIAGESLAQAQAVAARLAQERALSFIHPFDDAAVMAGQGTVGLEMIEDRPDLDLLVVPVGGGGLISGMAIAAKGVQPMIEVIGVQAASFPSMYHALRGEGPRSSGRTLAEGIAVEHPGILTSEAIRSYVDDIVLVEEVDIERSVALYLNVEKTVAEGAGAAGLAGVLAHAPRFRGRRVGLVLSGGNIDSRVLASILMRELVREGRIRTIRIPILDQPGALAKLTALLAAVGANILEVYHSRTTLTVPARQTDIELIFEARDGTHAAEIITALRAAGFAVLVPAP